MTPEFDVLIVGTGAGGGTVADRVSGLCRNGARVGLLEAGPHFPHSFFTQREIEMMDLFRLGGAWPTKNGAITLAAGQGVGGSTLVYTGVTFRLPPEVCRKWSVPGLSPEDLSPRFDALEQEVHVITPGEDMINKNNRLFKKGCEALGIGVELLRLNLKDCQQSGFCNLGCAEGAKQGTLEVQIPRAMDDGVELFPNCRVEKIREGEVHFRVSEAPKGTLSGPLPPGPAVFKARRIVLAAGSPESPAILLRSGLGRGLPALGRYFTLHPALTVYGLHPEEVLGFRGFPKTYYTPDFSSEHGYYLETAFYYPFVTTKHLGLWGKDLVRVMKRYKNLQCAIILNHDPAIPENRILVDPRGEAVLDYTIQESTKVSLCHAQRTAARMFFAAGCSEAVMPCAQKNLFGPGGVPGGDLEAFIPVSGFVENRIPLSSAHPQGGCRMGAGTEDSVCDAWGKVHGSEGVFVADASLFPQSSRVNPYLTVMALADRVAEAVIKSLS